MIFCIFPARPEGSQTCASRASGNAEYHPCCDVTTLQHFSTVCCNATSSCNILCHDCVGGPAGETGSQVKSADDAAFYETLVAYLHNTGIGNDGKHNAIPHVFWWSWNANSGDTGGIVDDTWITVCHDPLAVARMIQACSERKPVQPDAAHTLSWGSWPAVAGCHAAGLGWIRFWTGTMLCMHADLRES